MSKFKLRSKDSYTIEEKIDIFDRLYDVAIHMWKDTKKKKVFSDDNDHNSFEEIMGLLAYPEENGKFWEEFSRLLK